MGGLCPALQYFICPLFSSSLPIKRVTNMSASLRSAILLFRKLTICAGEEWSVINERIKLIVEAISKEAGIPFPDTSPIAKYRQLSRIK